MYASYRQINYNEQAPPPALLSKSALVVSHLLTGDSVEGNTTNRRPYDAKVPSSLSDLAQELQEAQRLIDHWHKKRFKLFYNNPMFYTYFIFPIVLEKRKKVIKTSARHVHMFMHNIHDIVKFSAIFMFVPIWRGAGWGTYFTISKNAFYFCRAFC